MSKDTVKPTGETLTAEGKRPLGGSWVPFALLVLFSLTRVGPIMGWATALLVLVLSLASACLLELALGGRLPFDWTTVALVCSFPWSFASFLGALPLLLALLEGNTPSFSYRNALPVVACAALVCLSLVAIAPRSKRLPVLLLGVALSLAPIPLLHSAFQFQYRAGQSATQDTATRLASNQALWETVRPSNYRYSFTLGCLCPGISGVVFTSEVHGKDPIISYEGVGLYGTRTHVNLVEEYATVDGLFVSAQAILQRYRQFGATYNPDWGFPETLSWGGLSEGEPVTLRVFDFTPLP